MMGFEGRGDLIIRLEDEKTTIAESKETIAALGIQETLGTAEFGNVYRPPGLKNPAGGLHKEKTIWLPCYDYWNRAPSIRKSVDSFEAFPPEVRRIAFFFSSMRFTLSHLLTMHTHAGS